MNLNFIAIQRRLNKPEIAALYNTVKSMRKTLGKPSLSTPPPKMSLGVSRLFNLGNYENLKYDLMVEVPPGAKPSDVMMKLVSIMRALKPKPPVPTYDYERAVKQLEAPQEWHKNLKPAKARRAAIKDMCVDAAKTVASYELWLKNRQKALEILDSLGGTSTGKDHKLDWPEDEWE